MYNNHQGAVYTIRGDMCYENKVMSNSVPSVAVSHEAVRLSGPDRTDGQSQPSQPPIPFRIRAGYIINVFIIIIVGVTLAFIEFDVIPTQTIGYHCRDPSLSHPFTGDTITATTLIVGSLVGPLIILCAVEFRKANLKSSLRLIWLWYKEMLVGLVTTLMITEVMKAIAGEHRPHFITTCSPDTEADCTAGEFIRSFKCTNSYYSFYTVGDSSRSFPSGHTSLSIFVSIFCAAYLQSRFKTRKLGEFAKPFFILLVLIWGPLCGLTRITDRRHHWWDVLAGTVIGIVGAIYTIVALVKKFRLPQKDIRSQSTTTLIDKNRHRASVII